MKRPIRQLLTPACLVVAGALALTACGGSSGSSDSADTGTSTAAQTSSTASGSPGGFQLTDEQRSCIDAKGVTIPGGAPGNGPPPGGTGAPPSSPPSGGPNGQDIRKLQQAFKACGVAVPSAPPGGAPAANQ